MTRTGLERIRHHYTDIASWKPTVKGIQFEVWIGERSSQEKLETVTVSLLDAFSFVNQIAVHRLAENALELMVSGFPMNRGFDAQTPQQIIEAVGTTNENLDPKLQRDHASPENVEKIVVYHRH